MPIPSPLHSRTGALNETQEWRNWSGYLAAALYEPLHDREYYAIRSAAALIDVSPLFKYEVSGPDALRLLNRVFTRDIARCAVGQVMYGPWCDDDGKLIDDGTVARLADQRYRMTAAEPNLAWLEDCALGMDVCIQDVSERLASLAIQGPNSRVILQAALKSAALGRPGIDLPGLKYYRLAEALAGDIPLAVTRTGYTGDLGYELWMRPEEAGAVWDRLMACGEGYVLAPAGMLALDIARIEAGLIMNAVDYISTRKALIEDQKSSPYEVGLGWAVDLRKPAFVGRKALAEEKRSGSKWKLVGLQVDWPDLEQIFGRWNLTPQVAGRASRAAVPVYAPGGGKQIGQMTSHTFSPLLKRYIGLATVLSEHAVEGSRLEAEVTVEYTRMRVKARVVKLPFFETPRKKG